MPGSSRENAPRLRDDEQNVRRILIGAQEAFLVWAHGELSITVSIAGTDSSITARPGLCHGSRRTRLLLPILAEAVKII